VKFVWTYESPDYLDMEALRSHFEAHRARWAQFRHQGTLLLIGPFADPRDGEAEVFDISRKYRSATVNDRRAPIIARGYLANRPQLPSTCSPLTH
jgi:uncharacterized protein YciI